MKKIAIFIDSYNDFDSILPFIDYTLLRGGVKIVLYKTKRSNLSGCEDHLSYLKKVYNLVPINYDQNFSKKYSFLMDAYWMFGSFAQKAKQNSYLLPFLLLFSRLDPIVRYLTQQEVNRKQKDIGTDVIMMDFGKELSLYGRAIVKYSQKAHIATVGYLHGFSIYTNLDTLQKDKVNLNPIKKLLVNFIKPRTIRPYFDKYIVGIDQKSSYFSSSMMSHYEKTELNRVLEIGAPRFAKEWILKYKENVIHPKNFTYGEDKKINVVLFMSHPQYNVHIDELMLTIKALSLCSTINFVYKPHTRYRLDRINLKELNGYDASKISSLELSSWADVGIVYGSSIAFQLLQDNVPLIMPKYIHSNTTIFEKNDVCIDVNNIDELINIFNYSKNEINCMINKKNVDNFIKHYIYGDSDYNALMGNFYSSINPM